MTSREPGARPTAAEVAAVLEPASRSLAAARAAQADIDTEALAIAPVRWWRRRRVRAAGLGGVAGMVALGLAIGLPHGRRSGLRTGRWVRPSR